MKRQKYSNGSSVVFSKSFKSIGDTNTNISSSFSGNKKNLNKSINFNVSSPSNTNNTSVFGSYRPNKNTEIKYQQNGKNRSLTFIRRF